MRKRILNFILVLLMVVICFPAMQVKAAASVTYDAEDEASVTEGTTESVIETNESEESDGQEVSERRELEPVHKTVTVQCTPEVDLPDNQELFAAFAERELYGYDVVTYGTAARAKLTALEQAIYDVLKTQIEAVALNGGSTVFDFSGVSNLKTTWTNEELGVDSIEDYTEVETAFYSQFNMVNILSALLRDCPFDLYWYDKTVGASIGFYMEVYGYDDGTKYIRNQASLSELTLTFAVSEEYSGGQYKVTTNVAKVNTAKNQVAQVVAAHAGKADYEKLVAYKEYICNAVSYNDAAAENVNTPYGDPWQLIYVFDGDASTNVVCEGYSKAFQYLCDLSTFADDTVCYSVTGWMDGENHMWNIVTLEGSNYLVDVTNSDAGTIGYDGSLFLAGAAGSPTGGYTVGDTGYVYDSYTQSLWGTGSDSILTLAFEGYTPGSGSDAHTHNFVSGVCGCGAVEISATTFPDANFRAYIMEQNYGQDGILTSDELSKVTVINAYNRNIKDLTGIEYFTALTGLSCWGNQLTSLDVSKCTALTVLDCTENQLTSLDVTKCTALTELYCYINQLTSLDVSKCTELTELECGDNQLTSLDVSKNTALTELYCWNNKIMNLDVSKCTVLRVLACFENQLTSLDVTKCTALTELYCYSNQLTSLDVSKCTALTTLYCNENQLTSLDVTKCTALTELYCYSNQLTSLDVSKCTALTVLDCTENQLTSLDVSKNTALTVLSCWNNKIMNLDVSNCTALEILYCNENLLTSLDVTKCTALTELYCYSNQLTSLDVSKCTELTELECGDNQLTSLDVAKCTALTTLYCYENQLTSLDVTKCTALTELYCNSNQLTSLDVTKCTVLSVLGCPENQLTSLDVTKCTALTELYCYGNQLASLDVSKCTALETLYCQRNQLTSLDVSKCTALTGLSCRANQLTNLDVSKCTALTVLYCDENQLTSLDLSKCTVLTELECNDNSRTVSVADNKFDLSNLAADGFDITKASNWVGGTVSGNILTVTADEITYTYALGNDKSETFTLVVKDSCDHDWKDATCTEPKTCSVCKRTEGSAKDHSYTDDTDATCNVCGYERQLEAAEHETVPVYRLYNPYTYEHLLTSGEAEKDALVSVGWHLDGVAWEAPVEGVPVYRLYNPYDDWHTYTISGEERDTMVAAGWHLDGVVSCGYADDDGKPIYRLFNPYVQTNFHLFTAGVDERDMLVNAGWKLEGIAWFAVK